ncbi:MAG: sporulation protein YqfC [Symbiobacteriia bacterium]
MEDPAKGPGGFHLKRRLTDLFDLPRDVTLDLPRVLLVGGLQVVIENHRGLIEYAPMRVAVGVARGQLVIQGEQLEIGIINAEEIMVLGRIRALSLED